MPVTYEPIATYTATGSVATYTFSSIPSTYTDIVIISSVQKTASGSGNGFNIRFNGDSNTNYSNTNIEGSGSSASSYRASNTVGLFAGALTSNANSAQFDVNINHIMNYANTTTYKTVVTRYNDNEFSYVGACVSLWRNTAAINSITIYAASNFASGSTFTLYGIKAA